MLLFCKNETNSKKIATKGNLKYKDIFARAIKDTPTPMAILRVI